MSCRIRSPRAFLANELPGAGRAGRHCRCRCRQRDGRPGVENARAAGRGGAVALRLVGRPAEEAVVRLRALRRRAAAADAPERWEGARRELQQLFDLLGRDRRSDRQRQRGDRGDERRREARPDRDAEAVRVGRSAGRGLARCRAATSPPASPSRRGRTHRRRARRRRWPWPRRSPCRTPAAGCPRRSRAAGRDARSARRCRRPRRRRTSCRSSWPRPPRCRGTTGPRRLARAGTTARRPDRCRARLRRTADRRGR